MSEQHTGGPEGTERQARERLARAQAGLLAALVADGPVPEGFDHERLEVQRRALIAKRADVLVKVAPELPRILGEKEYRTAFASYAGGRPMTGGYRQDALDFASWLLAQGRPAAFLPRRRLRRWLRARSGPRPLLLTRLRRALFAPR